MFRQFSAERVRQLELYRLDRIRLSLDPKKGDPRVADTLIRISERVASAGLKQARWLLRVESSESQCELLSLFGSRAYPWLDGY